MKALIVNRQGKKPVMKPDEHPKPQPGENELLVKIEATALNRADLLQKAGKYPPPEGASPVLGLEMAGYVEETGSNVTRFSAGDRVCGLLAGWGYAEYCTIREDHAMPVHEEYSFEEAAAIPEVFLTAFQALIWLGELKNGETALIHAGASGVGTAAIQLARQLCNARVAVTAGSEEKLKLCGSLGAVLLINYKEQSFSDIIETEFGTESVDLTIDFVGSPYWHNNIRVLRMDARVVYLSMLGGAAVEKMSLAPVLRKRLSIRGSTLRNRPDEYKARLVADFSRQTEELFQKGMLRPVIDSVFDWRDVEKAHKHMGDNKNAGKIILNGM
jgi:putative PIG3 family NAD(P)H quinone oxidoreductase